MKVLSTDLPEVLLIEPDVYKDQRGLFMELFNSNRYREFGIKESFVQDNYSVSCENTLRGLHYQLAKPQGKLVQVIEGEVFDVAVDIRHGSPNFGKCAGVILSDKNNYQYYVPPGFAHGFCVMSETVRFIYKCTEHYDPADELGIYWDDEELAIDWPVTNPLLSDRDRQLPKLKNVLAANLPIYLES